MRSALRAISWKSIRTPLGKSLTAAVLWLRCRKIFNSQWAILPIACTPIRLSARSVQLQSMVNCLGAKPRNYLDQKTVFKGASVFFDSALIRGQSYYRIRLTFDSLGHIAKDCGYRFADSSFVSDPSGKYDFYYIKQFTRRLSLESNSRCV